MENMVTENIPDIFDGAIHEDIDFDILGEDEFKWRVTTTQDTVPIITRNMAQRIHSDGYFKKRNGKQIASIPSVAYLAAKQAGWNLDDRRELYRFLDLHPQYATSEYRPKEARRGIIIK